MREYRLAELTASPLPLAVQKMNAPAYQPCHLHDAVEMVYIRHGAGWCAVGGVVQLMLTGDLFIIPVGVTHEYYSDSGVSLSYVNCLFDPGIFRDGEELLADFFAGCGKGGTPDKYTFGPEARERIGNLFDELHAELHSGEKFHVIRSRALFIELMVFILRGVSGAPGLRASRNQAQLSRVLCFIADRLDRKLPLKMLAGIAGYSPDYFGKLFRRELGVSLSEYILARRLEQAAWELEHTGRTVEEIARNTGFFDASCFIRKFRKYSGMTPLRFRFRRRERRNGEAVAGECRETGIPGDVTGGTQDI